MAASSASRVPFWDNARFAAVALVVVGHAIQRQTYDSDNALALYLFVYAFHMPAFAIISGFFTHADAPDGRRMRRVLTDLVLPYLVFEAIWSLVQFLVEGRPVFNPSEPSWTLWFLLALALFRVLLPYLALLRGPLVWAVVASVGVGYLANVDSTFSLSRAIGILPFFVLGWKLREWGLAERWMALRAGIWPVRAAAVAVLAGWFAVVLANVQAFRAFDLRFWFFYDDSYAALGEPVWWAGLLRLGLIALAVVLSAAFLALVPRRRTVFSVLGTGTMYVYLLHSFVLYPIRESGILRAEHSGAEWLALVVVASSLVAVVLATPLVRRVFRPLVEPDLAFLFRRDPDAPADAGRTRRDGQGLDAARPDDAARHPVTSDFARR